MLCYEIKSNVPDTASDLKAKALQEVKSKNILGDIATLTHCINPYAIEQIIIAHEGNTYKVYNCGDLVFQWTNYSLNRYICGAWSDVLAQEARAIRARQRRVEANDWRQTLANQQAAKNFIVCQVYRGVM